jgi:hypothetical protein
MNDNDKNSTRLSAFCFLASLTETGRDLYNDVYVPICKRALSYHCAHKNKSGLYTDLQSTIIELYGIIVPESIISLLLKRIQKSFSAKEQEKYSLILSEKTPKSFQFNDFVFTDYEDKYRSSQRDANLIENEFNQFASKNDQVSCPTFASFIEKYQKRLSGFFTGKDLINGDDIEISYLCHANFLKEIEQNRNDLYKISEQLYLGAIITSYFENEIELDAKFESGETYFIDTQIILQALDLQAEYETNPAKELLSIITNTGGKLKILGIILSELGHQIEKAIYKWDSKNSKTIINDACLRNKKGKEWLMLFNSDIQNRIEQELGVVLEVIPALLTEKFKNSTDIKELQKERFKYSAEHDVLAYLYVRHLRDKYISSIQKGKHWFVTNNGSLFKYNKEHSVTKKITEVALPDFLIGLLWLKDPTKYLDKVKKAGLSSIISTTFKEEIPSQELMYAYEEKVKNNLKITDEQYVYLHTAIAKESAKKIEKYLLEDEPEKVEQIALKLIKKAAEQQEQQKKQISEMDARMKELEKVIADKDKEKEKLGESNQKIEDKLVEGEKKIQDKDSEIDKYKNALIKEKLKRKLILYLFLILLFLLFIGWTVFYSSFGNQFKILWSSSAGLIIVAIDVIAKKSGLWSFISLIMNLFKQKK